MNNASAERYARLFKALMHPVRLQILDLLRSGEQCVCHLEAHLGQRQAYVSQQLAILRRAGLVADRRDGPNSFYRITRPEVLTLLDTAQAIAGEDSAAPDARPSACPCPRCAPAPSVSLLHTEEIPC
ncbi:MAG: metalloregulator ArsR/SmtB family transcription factor [Chloroflexaceae bacterium]